MQGELSYLSVRLYIVRIRRHIYTYSINIFYSSYRNLLSLIPNSSLREVFDYRQDIYTV